MALICTSLRYLEAVAVDPVFIEPLSGCTSLVTGTLAGKIANLSRVPEGHETANRKKYGP